MKSTTDLNMVNAYIPGRADVGPATAAMIARRDALLGPAYRLMYERPLHIVRGEGAWLIDPQGRRYLDAYNNVTSLGHCHPAVTEAICRQVQTLATNTRYLHDSILELAERLLASVPETQLAHLMLTCTGSEANDLAYRIAKVRTGGTGVIVTDTAYHGITDTVSKFSPSLGVTVDLGEHVRLVPAPRLYHAEGADLAERFTRDVEAAIADLQRHGIKPAALIVDSLFTSDGILPGPAGFLKGAVDAIKRAGGLFIADEVQPGFGRTGEHLWGFQRHGVLPDIVTMGKPMGNGQPIAGLLATADALAEFGKTSRYFNTFAGNTVSCVAALAVLDTIERDRLVQHAAKVGQDPARRHRRARRPARGHRRCARRGHVRRGRTRLRSRIANAGSQPHEPGGQPDARQGRADQRLCDGAQRAQDPTAAGADRGSGRPRHPGGSTNPSAKRARPARTDNDRPLALPSAHGPGSFPRPLRPQDPCAPRARGALLERRVGRRRGPEPEPVPRAHEAAAGNRRDPRLWRGHRAGEAGQCVIVFSEVTISSHRRPDFRKFEEAVDRHREIVEWYNVSGGYDYLLKIVTPSVVYFQELMERLLQDDVGIERFASRIVLRQASGRRTQPLGLIAAPPGRV